jgi:hypothetical protein
VAGIVALHFSVNLPDRRLWKSWPMTPHRRGFLLSRLRSSSLVWRAWQTQRSGAAASCMPCSRVTSRTRYSHTHHPLCLARGRRRPQGWHLGRIRHGRNQGGTGWLGPDLTLRLRSKFPLSRPSRNPTGYQKAREYRHHHLRDPSRIPDGDKEHRCQDNQLYCPLCQPKAG